MSNAGVNIFQMTLPLPDVSSDMPTSTHKLELELMHRWSTKTWMSAYSVPEDQQLLQIEIPRLALGEDYLLNSLLALSAADMYMSGRPEFRAPAYHYAQQSYADLNRKMQTVTKDDVISLHIMHLISGIFNYAMVQQTAYFRVVSSFFVGNAAADLFLAEINWRPPCCTAVQREGITLNALNNFLDDRASLGLSLLDTVADAFHVPKVSSPALLSAAAESMSLATAPASSVPVYKEVIQNTHRTFAEELRGATKLYFLFFGDKVPQEFVRQASRYEPMAMFICMYLGVVLYMTGRDRYFWWTRELGRNLVIETAGMLEFTSIVQLEAGRQGISWARIEIGLAA
ncbi:hypothetical protein LIA77_08860 [Sarocladium implicatum]|nr:hypothetical protein LIA77_08860 [Sarocladium implicatum]